jgi:hypothetical protein
VEFRNLTQQSVTIPAGTVVIGGDGVRFATRREAVVAAGVGETLSVAIEALEGGTAGNLEAESINAIEGRLGLSLSVINPEPTSGGRELPSVQASEADRERVKNLLLDDLETQARERLADELAPDDLLFEETLTVSQTLSEVYDPPPGAAGRNLTLSMQVEYSVRYAAASDLAELASLALNASLPSGYLAASDALTVTPVSSPSIDRDGSAKWTMRTERRIVRQIHPAQVSQMVQGSGAWNAASTLEQNLPLVNAPDIELSPSWWPWMPIVPFRISVVTR